MRGVDDDWPGSVARPRRVGEGGLNGWDTVDLEESIVEVVRVVVEVTGRVTAKVGGRAAHRPVLPPARVSRTHRNARTSTPARRWHNL